LADQYRKKSLNYRSDHLLMTIGDDFKYKTTEKTERLLAQWEMLFRYINDRPDEFRMQIRWSNLTAYFDGLRSFETQVRNAQVDKHIVI
jgi:hypothetical protein